MLEKLPEAIGHVLHAHRAGLEKILFNKSELELRAGVGQIEVTSLAFSDHAPIPARYTADAENPQSPPLNWRSVPQGTAMLALIVEDADSPTSEPLVHAIAVNIDPTRDGLAEGELHDDAPVDLGRNSYLKRAWLPPDPPPGHGAHRYAFQVFALSPGAQFSDAPGRPELELAIREHAVASGCLIGTYTRDSRVGVSDDEEAASVSIASAQLSAV